MHNCRVDHVKDQTKVVFFDLILMRCSSNKQSAKSTPPIDTFVQLYDVRTLNTNIFAFLVVEFGY